MFGVMNQNEEYVLEDGSILGKKMSCSVLPLAKFDDESSAGIWLVNMFPNEFKDFTVFKI